MKGWAAGLSYNIVNLWEKDGCVGSNHERG